VLLLASFVTPSIFATPIPQNLGNGLREIVQQQTRGPAMATQQQPLIFNYDALKITDAQNRILVSVVLDGTVALRDIQIKLTTLGVSITASTSRYRAGVIETFVAPAQAAEIAKIPGVSAVNLVLKPVHNIGSATTQGIVQHRIDKVPAGITGAGITVGVLSDSYNTSNAPIRARDDIASGDLPGPANPLGHTQPVVVFQEALGNDEGRAMLQIVHDIVPDARLGFATADAGEVKFADNIRSLAGLPSGSLSRPKFKANVIIDDVLYLDEPMFQDGLMAQAVDEVAASGVGYFSAAGNEPGSQAYDAPFRFVPNNLAAIAGTNLNFTSVDPALYKGGFHNFASGGAQDIAQTIHIEGFAALVLQWNEPFDATPPKLRQVLQSGSGTLTNSRPTRTFNFAGTTGQRIGIIADQAPGSTNPLLDVTITLIDPHGNQMAFQDATTDPELLVSFLPITGTYKIVIGGFDFATGDFIYEVREASGTLLVESDFNLLFFDANGKFLGAVAENNRATNRPIEVAFVQGLLDVQMVIARANKPPTGVPVADHLRYVWFDGGTLKEYIDYTTPATYGHNCAAGASGVAAYAFYPPFVPESFTSPGPVTMYFDADNNPLPQPDRRRKPDMAAMDGANTTFFVSDVPQDPDFQANFFGTSASAPHAGGIAALVLQAAGGPHSLAPDALRTILQASAFQHDLDPNHSQVVLQTGANNVLISADGDGTNTSVEDPNFFTVNYSGGNSLAAVTLNLSKANPTETVQGLVFDPTQATGVPFTLGNVKGVPASAITTTFSLPALPPATSGQYRRLTLSIEPGAMTSGDVIHFGVDRDEADAFGPIGAVDGNSADLLGAGVLIPQGTLAQGGATASVTLANGTTLQGIFVNQIGDGYSALDGFGFINAQAAVQAVSH
jgi:hypothetical protein